MIDRLIGDAVGSLGYDKPVTQERAQEIVNMLLSEMGEWADVRVRFTGYRTRNLHGRFYRKDGWFEIIIHKCGENEGVVIHELAHLWGRHHDARFRSFQRRLQEIWFGKEKVETLARQIEERNRRWYREKMEGAKQFKVGDTVKYVGWAKGLDHGAKGKVVKVKETRLSVVFWNGSWLIDARLLRKVGEIEPKVLANEVADQRT